MKLKFVIYMLKVKEVRVSVITVNDSIVLYVLHPLVWLVMSHVINVSDLL